jgi:hypothetical protein
MRFISLLAALAFASSALAAPPEPEPTGNPGDPESGHCQINGPQKAFCQVGEQVWTIQISVNGF